MSMWQNPFISFYVQGNLKFLVSTGARLYCGHQTRRIANCQEPNRSELKVHVFLTWLPRGFLNTLQKNWVGLLSLATMQQRALTQLLRHWFGLSPMVFSVNQ